MYMGHHQFLPIKHPLRRRHAHYDGKEIIIPSGKMVFEMVKDIKVLFGKGHGSRSVQSDDGRAPMWKKKSIFWDFPNWEVLEVRHAIDVMHITKIFV